MTTEIPQSIFLSPPEGLSNTEFMPSIARLVAMTSAVLALQAIEHIEIDHNGEDHHCSVNEILGSLGTIYSQAVVILRENQKPVPKMGTAIDTYIKHLFEGLEEESSEVEQITRKIAWLKNNKSQICDKFRQIREVPRNPNDLPLSMMLDITRHIARIAR